ncbi:MAG: YciI family protein [Burkholderiaceae bacterium]
MQFIALIYSEETGEASPEVMQAYGAFTQEMIAKGHFKAGDELQPSSTATCVSVRNGKTALKDGPFSETKEQLGGYYLLECADLDEAIACAAKIPTAAHGWVEVRPVVMR